MRVDITNTSKFVSIDDLAKYSDLATEAFHTLVNKNGAGNEFLGWINYPYEYDSSEYRRIKLASKFIRENAEVLVVIGIGGSYLGAKAVIEALKPYFKKQQTEIIFCGNTLSSSYTKELLDYLENKSFCINVISKSGTTTEPAIAFRLCKELLEKKYGKDAQKRIFATTDAKKGALRTLSEIEGYETFVVPDDIGGRYSWFTAVGLLPIACAGINIDELMQGAKDAHNELINDPTIINPAIKYALTRHILYEKSKKIEVLVSYEPKLKYISEWWKQLFGESEGKDHKGIFPASLVYSTDLHSMGQYIQDGERIMFETILHIENPSSDITLGTEKTDLDGLNYLSGKTLDSVNKQAELGTILAHVDGMVPNIVLNIEKIDEYNIGYLLYFFMFSCGICCYMTGVNPFNQPGVESYKKNMFALLGKPGYTDLQKELMERLNKGEKDE